MSADTGKGPLTHPDVRPPAGGRESALARYVASAKAAWRRHARAMSWEQKIAAIERMRERQAAIRRARRG
jgi:hypothetical protein